MIRAIVLCLIATLSLGASSAAAAAKDPAAAPSGTYSLDSRHASLIVRIGHQNDLSKSVFRFNGLAGALTWDAQQPERSAVTITVDPKSIATPVAGFAEDLAGAKYLKSEQFPTITFVSTSVRRNGADQGVITGDLTFLGVTLPLTLQVTFGGAGKSRNGAQLGFSATGAFSRKAFGLTYGSGAIGDAVDVVIDVEFDQKT